MLSVKKILQPQAIEASAPCRIDSGGTWDIKALALPLQRIEPVTLNMALNLRTWVSLSPFKNGWVILPVASSVTAAGMSVPCAFVRSAAWNTQNS